MLPCHYRAYKYHFILIIAKRIQYTFKLKVLSICLVNDKHFGVYFQLPNVSYLLGYLHFILNE